MFESFNIIARAIGDLRAVNWGRRAVASSAGTSLPRNSPGLQGQRNDTLTRGTHHGPQDPHRPPGAYVSIADWVRDPFRTLMERLMRGM